MTYTCCMPACKLRYKTFKSDGRKIKLHSFPRNSEMSRTWYEIIRKEIGPKFKLRSSTKVCSRHFNESDIITSVVNGKFKLKANAIPTLFGADIREITDEQCTILPPCDIKKELDEISDTELSSVDPTLLPVTSILNHHSITLPECDLLQSDIKTEIKREEFDSVAIHDYLPPDVSDYITADSMENCNPTFIRSTTTSPVTCKHCRSTLQEKDNVIRTLDEEIDRLTNKVNLLEETIAELNEFKLQNCTVDMKLSSLRTELKAVQETNTRLVKVLAQKSQQLVDLATENSKLTKRKFSIETFKNNDKDIMFYTGIPSYNQLMKIYEHLSPGTDGENVIWDNAEIKPALSTPRQTLTALDKFFLVLVRLRLGLFEKDLADRFEISTKTCSRIIFCWINYMHIKLSTLITWPTKEEITKTLPESFKELYPSARVMIDIVEIKCEASTSLSVHARKYCNYKSSAAYKGLIGLTPDGKVSFLSTLYPGSISDKELVDKSGILQMAFDNNDSIIAIKELDITKLLIVKQKRLVVNVPSIFRSSKTFSAAKINVMEKMANLRFHVERRVAQVKAYHILDRPFPIGSTDFAGHSWMVCALLTNFQDPLPFEQAYNALDEIEAPLNCLK